MALSYPAFCQKHPDGHQYEIRARTDTDHHVTVVLSHWSAHADAHQLLAEMIQEAERGLEMGVSIGVGSPGLRPRYGRLVEAQIFRRAVP